LVEQSSNGIDWKEVGLVGGSGNTLEPTTYSFTTSSVSEFNYYRLKQVDFDGGYEYSETVISNCNVNKSPVIREFNILGQDVKLSTKGIVFLLYEDGKVEKVYRK